jgi:hypothetical protein
MYPPCAWRRMWKRPFLGQRSPRRCAPWPGRFRPLPFKRVKFGRFRIRSAGGSFPFSTLLVVGDQCSLPGGLLYRTGVLEVLQRFGLKFRQSGVCADRRRDSRSTARWTRAGQPKHSSILEDAAGTTRSCVSGGRVSGLPFLCRLVTSDSNAAYRISPVAVILSNASREPQTHCSPCSTARLARGLALGFAIGHLFRDGR